MNERYLFRGKRKDNNAWVEGYHVCLNGNCHFIYTGYAETDCGYYYPDCHEVIPETVGQCTGRKDKNGKLIFEGDIVKGLFNFGLKIMSVCTFKDGAFGLTAKQCGAYHFSAFASACNVKYEVIDNIHDNPNLLKIEHDSLCETETYKAGDEE